ncbi:c-type cytochrome [Ectothiorhodospiraceae bacterium 2226]|nr:c-type cytochrome [Ectothiorhodospiraceae bacterium 2226]
MKSVNNLTFRALVVGVLGLALQAPLHADEEQVLDYQVELPETPDGAVKFKPISDDRIPDDGFGEMVRYGESLFVDTQQLRGKYVGNDMNCVNCHLDRGRKADSSPMWAAYTMYPAYRRKNDKVNTNEERVAGCFEFSMNGTPPPPSSKEMTALMTYMYWMSTGAPTGIPLEGRGYPTVAKPAQEPDIRRGKGVYEASCAICHGADGEGQKVEGKVVFPPLWGENSYNFGAGMHRINTAASFIKHNMPLGKPGTLSDQEAWDVAAYINSHERPQDPRFDKTLAHTHDVFHADEQCYYGKEIDGHVLGTKSYPNPLRETAAR